MKGQRAGHTGEETSLVMDTFPYVALSKVGALRLSASSFTVGMFN